MGSLATVSEACSSCGLAVAGGMEGCQRLFESIGLREYDDMRFARYHRIVVDVYAMQHPDRYGRSAKSFAAHLTGLCAWLEDETGAQAVNAVVQRWLSGPSPIEKPALPASYGALTLHALRSFVGESQFASAMDAFGLANAGRVVAAAIEQRLADLGYLE